MVKDGIIRSVDGMVNQGKGIIGEPMGQGHGLAGIQKRFGADHRGRDAQLFHDDAVEHTARTAGTSVPYTGDDGLGLGRQIPGHLFRDPMGGGRFPDILKGNIRIPLLNPRRDFFQDIVRIPLAVVDKPNGQA
jgi:hypothetical protein